jgi:ubiquinone/menaquinone biosynthesis C-methylase UbiE
MPEDNLKSIVKDQFGKNAEKYVASESHAKGDDLSLLVEWLNPASDWTVVDIATGGGHVTKALSPHVSHIFATDLTHQMLESAKKHINETCSNVWYVLADAEALPFLDQSFDTLVCRIAAHHFPNPKKFVEEAYRVLKPGGKLLLIDNIAPEEPTLDTFMNTLEKLRDRSHVRCYSKSEWTAWFENAGLAHRKSILRKKTHNFPVWVRRTTETDEQVQLVEKHILTASKEEQEYFSIVLKENQILSVQVDEWMVMLEKESSEN